mgnify:CR=1 FL=1
MTTEATPLQKAQAEYAMIVSAGVSDDYGSLGTDHRISFEFIRLQLLGDALARLAQVGGYGSTFAIAERAEILAELRAMQEETP